jgi:dienelactone hydrolase
VTVERINYQAGSVTGKGALIWNEKVSGKRPLLLVMTNWLGVTDHAINRAAKMAGDKYVAFVADMYGDGKTSGGPPESQDLMMAVRKDRVEGRKRVVAGLNTMIAEADRRGVGDS